jgi:hypothetical protein
LFSVPQTGLAAFVSTPRCRCGPTRSPLSWVEDVSSHDLPEA